MTHKTMGIMTLALISGGVLDPADGVLIEVKWRKGHYGNWNIYWRMENYETMVIALQSYNQQVD